MSASQPRSGAVRYVTASEGDAGQRIDNFLLRILKGVPRSHIYRIVRRGEVRVNGGRVKSTYRLSVGDDVRVPPVQVTPLGNRSVVSAVLKERIAKAICYEDKLLLAINKPAGLAVHGGSGVAHGVIEVLRAWRPAARELELVHRLDRDTSGVLLVAKRRSALRRLHEVLREGHADKRYLALLQGCWRRDRREVSAPLRKNVLQGGERVVRVDPAGKPSRTEFRVLRRFAETLLVEARLHTGRTHQIRVHAQYLGTPVAGDPKYGDAAANRRLADMGLRRLFLHAASISFDWGEPPRRLTIEAPLASELEVFLTRLERADGN
jgi:23S rRNA pseudouridine955/2504/2580 synthase